MKTQNKENTNEQVEAPKNIQQIYQSIRDKVGKIEKNAKNPFYNSTYADLNNILDALNPILKEEGLIINQRSIPTEKLNYLALKSVVCDLETGEELDSMIIETPIKSSDPQAMGSAISYMRRYSYTLLLGLQMSDDDGNEATHGEYKVYSQKIAELAKRAKDMAVEELDTQTARAIEITAKYPDLQKKAKAIRDAYIEG